MITLYYGKREDQPKPLLERIPGTFRINYQPTWVDDNLSRKLLEEVERVKVESPWCLHHYAYGQISPYMISSGVQHLLLMRHCPNLRKTHMFDCAYFGDNCAPYIQLMAQEIDIDLYVDRYVKWDNNLLSKYPIVSYFSKKYLYSFSEFIDDECDWEDAFYGDDDDD